MIFFTIQTFKTSHVCNVLYYIRSQISSNNFFDAEIFVSLMFRSPFFSFYLRIFKIKKYRDYFEAILTGQKSSLWPCELNHKKNECTETNKHPDIQIRYTYISISILYYLFQILVKSL